MHFQNEVVPNARVTIIELSRRRHEVQTDELGRFSLDVPNRQVQLVVASAGGLVGLAADPPQDTVDVQLRVPWRVSGVVRDAAGAPVAGARVLGSWSVSTCTGPYEGQPLFETTTSATGAYEVTVPVSHAWIAAVANGLASKSTIDLTGAPESSPFDLALPAEPSELTAELAALVRRPR